MDKYVQYIEEFIETKKIKEKENFINLVKKMEGIDKFITDWNSNDLDLLIKSTNSISVNSINKYTQFAKAFYKYVCEKHNVTPKNLVLSKDYTYYIDLERLNGVTLTESQYNWLKNELLIHTSIHDDSGDFFWNYRDKVMVELAWEGLSNEEIKNLKISDIKWINNDKSVILSLKKRSLRIDNEEIAYDLKKAKEQDKYYIPETLNKKEQWRDLKYSDNIIRPVATRQGKNEGVCNPSQILKNVFRKIDIGIIPGVDLENLTLEDIKRSSIINMFSKNKNITIAEVKNKFGKKTECDLYWLQRLAKD